MSKADLKVALRALARAQAEGETPDFGRFELGVWSRAVAKLVQQGNMERAAFAVRRMHEASPAFEWAANMDRLFRLMPPADPGAPPFTHDPEAAVQIVRRPGAETALLVFCGVGHQAGMPLPMLHRWLVRWPVSLIYLCDLNALGYLGGLEPLGADRAATVESLRRTVGELGAKRMVCCGPSIGGYGALRYSLELGAAATVLFSGITNMDPDFNVGLHYARMALKLQGTFPGEILDLKELCLAAADPPTVFAAYAQHNWDDRLHAEHLADVEGVVTIQMRGAKSHNTIVEMIQGGQFDDFIRNALTADAPTHGMGGVRGPLDEVIRA